MRITKTANVTPIPTARPGMIFCSVCTFFSVVVDISSDAGSLVGVLSSILFDSVGVPVTAGMLAGTTVGRIEVALIVSSIVVMVTVNDVD